VGPFDSLALPGSAANFFCICNKLLDETVTNFVLEAMRWKSVTIWEGGESGRSLDDEEAR
jgi:hypothetical protein